MLNAEEGTTRVPDTTYTEGFQFPMLGKVRATYTTGGARPSCSIKANKALLCLAVKRHNFSSELQTCAARDPLNAAVLTATGAMTDIGGKLVHAGAINGGDAPRHFLPPSITTRPTGVLPFARKVMGVLAWAGC